MPELRSHQVLVVTGRGQPRSIGSASLRRPSTDLSTVDLRLYRHLQVASWAAISDVKFGI